MVPGGEATCTPHKYLGYGSSSSGSRTFFTKSQQQSSIVGIGQHISSVVPQKARGTKPRDLFLEAKHLFCTVMELRITLQARQKRMVNQSPDIQKSVQDYGKPLIDLFTTQFNHIFPLYMSIIPDRREVVVYAPSQDFPPIEILDLVLSNIDREQFQVIFNKASNKAFRNKDTNKDSRNQEPQSSMVHTNPGVMNSTHGTYPTSPPKQRLFWSGVQNGVFVRQTEHK